MQDNVIVYEDIFEAIRAFEPYNPILQIKDGYPKGKRLIRNDKQYLAMRLLNGKIGTIPVGFQFDLLYRGECKDYEKCIPSIYRNSTEADILISKLKIKELECILREYDEIQEDEKANINVDFIAIAQHYGLGTNLLDLTSDISIAAFFATNQYNVEKDKYNVITNGVGVLKRYISSEIVGMDPKIHIEGIQRFQRPVIQMAFGVEADREMSSKFVKVFFKQNEKYNSILTNLFIREGKNILFPKERISEIINKIRNSNKISEIAIKEYIAENNIFVESIIETLNNTIKITKELTYKLTKEDIQRFQKEEAQIEYQISSRLMSK